MKVLASGANFEITEDGSLAHCAIQNPPDLTPEEGARCAREIRDVLFDRVLKRHSPFRGLLFDVRHGPPVFGPKTRASLEVLFRAAEEHRKPLAVLLGDGAVQRLQFQALCRECAPTYSRVSDAGEAAAWIERTAKPSVKG